jgi:hypothetical protein
VTLEFRTARAAPSSSPSAGRLTPRSSIAVADVERARHTLAELAEPNPVEEAGERMLARLRRFVVRDVEDLNSRS